jgi:hypothetical protein
LVKTNYEVQPCGAREKILEATDEHGLARIRSSLRREFCSWHGVWADLSRIVEEQAPELRSRSEVEQQGYLEKGGPEVIEGLGFVCGVQL